MLFRSHLYCFHIEKETALHGLSHGLAGKLGYSLLILVFEYRLLMCFLVKITEASEILEILKKKWAYLTGKIA